MSASARLHVEPLAGDRWTWKYVETDTGIELCSNEMYGSREEAVDWACRAYPDLEVADPEG